MNINGKKSSQEFPEEYALKYLLILPPFVTGRLPSLPLSSLKEVIKARGHQVTLLYANLIYKSLVSRDLYEQYSRPFFQVLRTEWVFCKEAFGLTTPAGRLEKKALHRLRARVPRFMELLENRIEAEKPEKVLLYSRIKQTTAAIAIARRIKERWPGVEITAGGHRWLPPMDKALTTPWIDRVISGDLEKVLFSREDHLGWGNMETLPLPEYDDFFEQARKLYLYDAGRNIPLEASRGCPWGQCLFCGHYPDLVTFCPKSPEKVKEEIKALIRKYDPISLMATDCMLPPALGRKIFQDLSLDVESTFFEIKPTIDYPTLKLLKEKINLVCQSGIETLNHQLLERLRKGTTLLENLRFLRDCRELEISVIWNYLYNIPGEKPFHYREMAALIPWITHLPPPGELRPLSIMRYTPLQAEPEKWGITNLRPQKLYRKIFPREMNMEKGALFFEGDYPRALDNPFLRWHFFLKVKKWQNLWTKPRVPELLFEPEHSRVKDSRTRKNVYHPLTPGEAELLKTLCQPRKIEKKEKADLTALLSRGLVVREGEMAVSLVLSGREAVH